MLNLVPASPRPLLFGQRHPAAQYRDNAISEEAALAKGMEEKANQL